MKFRNQKQYDLGEQKPSQLIWKERLAKYFGPVQSFRGWTWVVQARLTIFEFLLMFFVVAWLVLWLDASTLSPSITFSSEEANLYVQKLDGALATVWFFSLNNLLFVLYIFLKRKQGVKYSQGDWKN